MNTLLELIPSPEEIPSQFRFPETVNRQYLLNGLQKWEGTQLAVHSPIPLRMGDGSIVQPALGSIPRLTEAVANEAVARAAAAFDAGDGPWPSLSLEQRADVVRRFVADLRPLRDRIALHIMWEVGKVFEEAQNEFDRTLEYALETVEAALDLDKRERRDTSLQQVVGRVDLLPVGPALCVGPYNYPFYETLTNAIPALLMGNTVIIKAPPQGALLYSLLLPVFATHFPGGIVSVLFGDGEELLAPMMRSGRISIFAFIGTSSTADALVKMHPAPHRLHTVLGLEAKNAAIVMPDAPLEITLEEVVKGALAFNGQRCAAIKMLFVHEQIAETFIDRLSAAFADSVPGMPWDAVRCTPVISPAHAEYLETLLHDAIEKGARLLTPHGGERTATLLRPALLGDVHEGMRLYDEEQFGPLLPVVVFNDAASALQYIKHARYGQQCSIFGSDPALLRDMITAAARYVGRVNINGKCQRGPDHFPFTGKRDSALGTVSIEEALRRFCISTVIATPEYPENTALWKRLG
ncbi:aldehyde dehydrogenase family protein [bacterium]|nr:aldehyde dehydrogenase family protein [bacterium]